MDTRNILFVYLFKSNSYQKSRLHCININADHWCVSPPNLVYNKITCLGMKHFISVSLMLSLPTGQSMESNAIYTRTGLSTEDVTDIMLFGFH